MGSCIGSKPKSVIWLLRPLASAASGSSVLSVYFFVFAPPSSSRVRESPAIFIQCRQPTARCAASSGTCIVSSPSAPPPAFASTSTSAATQATDLDLPRTLKHPQPARLPGSDTHLSHPAASPTWGTRPASDDVFFVTIPRSHDADSLCSVPKFFRWLSERYPAISQLIAENRIPEFDCLYVRQPLSPLPAFRQLPRSLPVLLLSRAPLR